MRHTFFCIDGHTAGNPVRLIAGGAPLLRGATMSARRQDFLTRFDWIRTGLVLEPRGHDLMSGGFLYPPTQEDTDAGILFIETSGCLPMCGHGTIGIITFALEHGLLKPRTQGHLRMEVPAGLIDIAYKTEAQKVTAVKLTNVPAYLAAESITITVPNLGPLTMDIAYGGNFYAIIEPQPAYPGIDSLGPAAILTLSPLIRTLVRETIHPIHPLDPTINGVTHILWADAPKTPGADARNAVFYGDRAIDRSPCGTGTSARMAQLAARGRLHPGDTFIHESIIGSRFTGRVEAATTLAGIPAIVPSIEGQAYATGFNTIWIDEAEPFPHGFQVT
jgi:4-hydroxyproline epimerase